MPSGIYKRKPHTEEARKRMSLSQTGKKRKPHTRKPPTIETRLKMSKTRKGMKKSEETKKRMSEAKKNMSEETKFKIGLALKGSKSHLWKGGISPENKRIRGSIEYRLWREAVFARDNWTCQKCNKRDGGEIHPHHIKNFAQFPELRFAIDNGIIFCKDCHLEFHKIYGRKNNTKQQLNEFLN